MALAALGCWSISGVGVVGDLRPDLGEIAAPLSSVHLAVMTGTHRRSDHIAMALAARPRSPPPMRYQQEPAISAADERALPRWEPAPAGRIASVAAVAGVVGVLVFGGFVPEGGALEWRAPGGEGLGAGGGFAASRFVGLRQSLVSLSDDPVFVATVEPERPEGTAGYWRLLTLDQYTGQEWVAREQSFSAPGRDIDVPTAETRTVVQTVRIESLRDDRLPSSISPRASPGRTR